MNMNMVAMCPENDRYLWCISQEDAYLYRIDKEKEVLEELIALTDDIYMQNAFLDMVEYLNWLILIPSKGDDVVLVNRDTLEKRTIKLPVAESFIGTTGMKFRTGLVHHNNLFMFGCAYPGIVKVNLESREIEVRDSWLLGQDIVFNDSADGCFFNNYCLLDNIVYLPFVNTNAVMQFDLEKEEITIYKVGNDTQRYISIEWDGQWFWLIPRDGSKGAIIKWNPDKGVTEEISGYPVEYDYHKLAFYRSQIIDDRLLLFAHCGQHNISIDVTTGQMTTFPHLYKVEGVRGSKYPIVLKEKDNIVTLHNGEYIVWNYVENHIGRFGYKLDDEISLRYEKKRLIEYFGENQLKYENENAGLEEFLRYVLFESDEIDEGLGR